VAKAIYATILRRDFRGLVTFGKTGQKRKKNKTWLKRPILQKVGFL